MEYLSQSADICKSTGNKKLEAEVINLAGNTYFYLRIFDKALEVYLRALELNRESGDGNEEVRILNMIGKCYYLSGYLDNAQKYCSEALKKSVDIGDESERGIALKCLEDIFMKRKQK